MEVIIIGAGPAGVSAAETIRKHDREAKLVMLNAEPYPPYSPAAMSDHFLTGSGSHLWRGTDWPERFDIDYRNGVSVETVRPGQKKVMIQKGEALSFDRLIIATGSRLFAPIEGVEKDGICNFKSLSAAEKLMGLVRLGKLKTAIIVGAGFIGLEIAALLSKSGIAVTIVEMSDQVMPRVLDSDTADRVIESLRKAGIDVRLHTKVVAFTGDHKARGVAIESGEELRADILVAATGVAPNLGLLDGSGIRCGRGILVDDRLRTNFPDVYAAGDVAESNDLLTGSPVINPIFPKAIEQGGIVGLNAVGLDASSRGTIRMNSLKHLDFPVIAVGLKDGDEVLKGKSGGCLRTCYLKNNRLVGFALTGDLRVAGILYSLLAKKTDVSSIKDRLLDISFGQGVVSMASFPT